MNNNVSMPPMETTGRYLVLLPENDIDAGIRALADSTGIRTMARASDFAFNTISAEQLNNAEITVFDRLGVAVVSVDPDRAQSMRTTMSTGRAIMAIEPERVVYAIGTNTSVAFSHDYLKGYQDAINHLIGEAIVADDQLTATAFVDGMATWGLQATRVVDTPFSGLGVKIAVLDTGLDLTHPDFLGRKITSQSFVFGEEVQDIKGHGTHCIGTACGPQNPSTLPRYGVAYNAEIFAGKVLSNQGSGTDGNILAGIEWAIANGCQVISMSLGASVRPGEAFSEIYEEIGQRALRRGTLIVAAAGNDSRDPFTGRRFNPPHPVSRPANSPSIMAVAAVDSQLLVAAFSNSSLNPRGGQVDIAGPGVDVYSTWPMPLRNKIIDGTSMATPHVAGIAALYIEATGQTGANLWGILTRNAQRLPLSSADVGTGLVQAPL